MPRQAGPTLGSLFNLKEKVKDTPFSIDSYEFDREIYQEIHDTSKPIKQTVKEGDSIIKTYPELAQDMYMSLYKHKPYMNDEEDMRGTHQFNHQLMQELMEMPEFRKLRSKTRLDMMASTMGLEIMSQQAISTLKYYEQKMKEENAAKGQPDAPTLFDQINDAVNGTNGTGSGAPGAGPGMPGQGQGGGAAGGMTNQQAQDLANQQAQNQTPPPPFKPDPQQLQNLMDQMKKDMAKAADDALKDVSDMRDFLQAWGMDGGDPNNRIPYESKKKALQRLRNSSKLKKLTELIGHMKKLAINEQKQKAPEGAEAIKSVTMGDNITAVLPSELAQLASSNPALKRNFYRKLADKELLEYDKDVYQSMGKGPMIVCVDVSGSMSGHREEWSKAVALALLEIANKQKRNYACIHYESRVSGVWEIPHGQLKPEDVFDIAEKFAGGGTNFEAPLRKSMEIMNNNKFKKGDVVFITDGDCGVRQEFIDEFRKAKKEKEFQVHTVLIDAYGGGATGAVKEFSDKIIPLSDLRKGGDAVAKDIFRNV